jgi:hypothetical protein
LKREAIAVSIDNGGLEHHPLCDIGVEIYPLDSRTREIFIGSGDQ